MNSYTRKKEMKWFLPFLVFMLILAPLVQAPYAHAEEGITPVQSTIPTSTVTEATYEPTNPVAPQHLRLAEGELKHNTAKIEWDFRDDRDDNNIQIYYADTNGYINWGNYYSRTLTGLKPETTYRIYITWNADSAKSNVLEFTTPADTSEYPDTPLTPPSALSVSDVTYDTVNLSWGSSPGANGYDVYVNGGWVGGRSEEQDTTYAYKPAGGLIDGKTYTFKVGAQKKEYPVSKNSNAVTITWGELATPQGLAVITATRSEVSLGWAPVPGATEYEVYQSGTLLGTTADVRYVADDVKEGQKYTYSVIAKNSLWTSEASEEVSAVPGSSYNNISYFPAWAVYADGRNFQPEDVVVSKLTHVNYAFADLCWRGINSKGENCQDDKIPLQSDYVFDGEMIIGDKEKDIDNFIRFNAMKSENPNLKMMISVGGWSWSDNFSHMARTEVTRRAFADSAVDFLRAYHLDGLDIDWEYPVEGGEDNNSRGPEDKENFTLLMKTVREALDAAGGEDGTYYLLTIASGQGDNFVVNLDLKNSVVYLDFINIMTYDYSGTWEPMANHNSPLFYDRNLPKSSAPRNNVLGGLLGHLNGGVPEYKLLAGVPYYGKGWSGCPSPGEYAICNGAPPKGSWEPGTFDFYDIQNNYVNKNGYTHTWNEAAKVSYVYNPTTQIFLTYNDETTMKYTASMIKSLDIAGAMSWEVTGDRSNTLINELVHNLPIYGAVNTEELAAPKNVSFEKVEDQKYIVHWDAVPGATNYEVFVDSEYIATTQKTSHMISVNASEEHVVRLLATKKSGGSIEKVSNFTTQKVKVTSPEPNPGSNPSPPVTSTPNPPSQVLESNQLETRVVIDGDTAKVTLDTENALKTIRTWAEANFKIVVKSSTKQTEITLPQAVVAAIAKKSTTASLTLIINGAEQRIPASLLVGSADVKVMTSVPSDAESKAATALLKDSKILSGPLQLKIEHMTAKGAAEEIKGYGTSYVSEFITLDSQEVDNKHLAGFVYISGSNEIRPVPTLVTTSANGTVKVEIKKTAGGIYLLAERNIEFTSTVSAWAQEDVEQAFFKQILLGNDNGTIQAKEHISREEVTSILVRGLGLLADASDTNFIDVSRESTYARDIATAKGASLVKGKTNGIFDGNAAITREELAAIIANALEYAGKHEQANPTTLMQFKDQKDISPYAKTSVALLVEKKLLNGVSASSLAPQKNVTKEEAIVVIMRTMRYLNLSNN